MRGTATGLGTPHPMGGLLPAVYSDDDFTMRWTQALDEVLAPALASLDCLAAYIDPLLAPEDFLAWLAGWFGMVLDETWPVPRRHAMVAAAAELYRTRGTVAGLRAHLELVTGGQVRITDNGGVTWSAVPADESGTDEIPMLTVQVTAAEPEQLNARALDALIGAIKPAHVIHRLEVAVS